MPDSTAASRFKIEHCIIAVIDLAGFAEGFRHHSDLAMAHFIDDYYQVCTDCLTPKPGRIVKFIGDACLATFEPSAARSAVDGILELATAAKALGHRHGLELELGANLGFGEVVSGKLGPDRVDDIIGSAVNKTFRLGRGPGLRLSEAVYRLLPSDARSGWLKHKPAVLYTRCL